MRTIWQSLAWKEWHEHKWKLASIAVILLAIAAMYLREPDASLLRFSLLLCTVPLAVFVGLGVAAGERSNGTMRFLQSLPIPIWKAALTKALFGWVAILVPVLLALALLYVWLGADLRAAIARQALQEVSDPLSLGTENWFIDSALMLALIATSFFAWTIAAGVNRKDEISAGAGALAVIVGWCALLFVTWNFHVHWFGYPPANREVMKWLFTPLVCTAPGGITFIDEFHRVYGGRLILVGLLACALSSIALAYTYVARFGSSTERDVTSPQLAVVDAPLRDWLAPPRISPLRAIVWKQFRESGPIVLASFAAVFGIVFLFSFSGGSSALGENYAVGSIAVGMLIALIVGVGVEFNDVRPRLNNFWRSRPINPDMWFWTKYLSGLTILLATIYGPLILFAVLGDYSGIEYVAHPEMYVFPALHVALFAAAVAMTSLVRHAVYAAILSMGAMYFGIPIVWIAGRLGIYEGGAVSIYEMTEFQVVVGLCINFIVATLVGWLAVRNDWGQGRKY